VEVFDPASTRVKLALTSPTSGGRSVGIVRWRTEAPEEFFSPDLQTKILYALKSALFVLYVQFAPSSLVSNEACHILLITFSDALKVSLWHFMAKMSFPAHESGQLDERS
jgi:hypothetical protein